MNDNAVRITHPGDEQQFIKLADGSFNPPPGEADTLIEEAGGSYLYTTKHGVALDFDGAGKLRPRPCCGPPGSPRSSP